jgi:dTMP kinase
LKGYFITFEGIEGSGKSTQIIRVASYLGKKGYSVCVTREPGDTPLGKKIRSIFLGKAAGPVSPKTELFLCLADRAQHMQEVILPALDKGEVVLCDRFTDSTLIYQGVARSIRFSQMSSLLAFAAESVIPNRTFLLDLPTKKGLSRAGKRKEKNRLDCEAAPFHQQVREGYLALAREKPDRIRTIDADQTEARVFAQIRKELHDLFP